jgi:hypothetical protein
MSTKKIERIIQSNQTHFVGDGFKVHNIIPGMQGLSMQRMSPFIMMDYNAPHYFSPSETPRGVENSVFNETGIHIPDKLLKDPLYKKLISLLK